MNRDENHGTGEVSALDLLVVVAESWLLIVIGTILAVAVAYLLASAQPPSYQTSAVLSLPSAEVERLLNADPDTEAPETLATIESIQAVADDVTTANGPIDGTTRVSLTAGSALVARERLSALVAAYDSLVGRSLLEGRRTRLQTERTLAEGRIAEIEDASGRVVGAMGRIDAAPSFDGTAFAQLASIDQQLGTELFGLKKRIAELQTSLGALPETIVLWPPSPPATTDARSPYVIAALAGITAAFALLVVAFVRSGVRLAGQGPEGAAKLQRIRRALLRSRTTS